MNTQIKGNLSLTRNAILGGNLTAAGNATVKGRLVVEGWLDAPHLKSPCKGLFTSAECLSEAYPDPRPGWWALVGDSIPAPVYVARAGGWSPTGLTGGSTEVDLTRYDDLIDQTRESIAALGESVAEDIAALEESVAEDIDAAIETVARDIVHPVSTKQISNADLIIADENETPILTVSGGHIRTANFDSASISTSGGSSVQTPGSSPGSVNISSGTPSVLRVASYNVGHFCNGGGVYLPGDFTTKPNGSTPSKQDRWKAFLAQIGADVLLMQEYTAGANIFDGYNLCPQQSGTSSGSGFRFNAIASKSAATSASTIQPCDSVSDKIVKAKLTVGGKAVWICTAHADWGQDAAQLAYFRTIIDHFADDPYVIIGADTNARRSCFDALRNMFINAGYQLANWTTHGHLCTDSGYAPNSEWEPGIDNIFVKGASITSVRTWPVLPEGASYDTPYATSAIPLENWAALNLSDHFPITADILFR